ncbi:hypothetical protein GC173_08175 [bacterium]|nr:hypothetical protein [bacterium]
MTKLSLVGALTILAQGSTAVPLPDLAAIGASAASVGSVGLLLWLLMQERAERERRQAEAAAERERLRGEFLAELREQRAAIGPLTQQIAALVVELRERDR